MNAKNTITTTDTNKDSAHTENNEAIASTFAFASLDPSRKGPDYIKSISCDIEKTDEVSGQHCSIKTIDVAIKHHDGSIHKEKHTVGYPKNQDVLDLLCYFEKDGQTYIVINESHRAPVIARHDLIHFKSDRDQVNDGKIAELPAKILRPEEGDLSISEAIDTLLAQKIGAKKVDEQFLTGAYYPSIGSSAECCQARAIQISAPDNLDGKVVFGKEFQAQRVILYKTPQDIINDFAAGIFTDVRLVFLTLQLARQKNISLDMSAFTKVPGTYKTPVLQQEMDWSTRGFEPNEVTAATVRDTVAHDTIQAGISDISINVSDVNDHSFLHMYNAHITQERNNGKEEQYTAEMIVRDNVDSIDVAAYYWNKGKLYMKIKAGIRPVIKARNLQSHPIHTESNVFNIEGISGTLAKDTTFVNKLYGNAGTILTNKTGLEPDYLKTHLIGSYFPSAGHSPEMAHLFLSEIDPSKQGDADKFMGEDVLVYDMEVDQILEAGDQGIIRDPRLLLQANLLKQYYNYVSPDAPATLDEKKELQAIVNAPSQTKKFLQTFAPGIDNALSDIDIYRKLVNYIEQEKGAVIGEGLVDDVEKHFFSAMIPIMAKPEVDRDNYAKVPFYLLHDFNHYAMGEYIPFRKNAEGNREMISEEEYIAAMSWTECKAVHYSDYMIPVRFGVDKAEAIFGGKSVARALIDLGIGEDKAYDVIVSIERDGIIPDKILQHPKYEEHKDVIVDRLLRFYVMDREQSKGQYNNWKRYPEVARIALRFCKTYNTIDEFTNNFDVAMDEIQDYHEGVNTIKSMIMRTVNYRIRTLALKYGVFMSLANENGADGIEISRAKQAVNTLEDIANKLTALNGTIENMDYSTHNIKVMRLHKHYNKLIDDLENTYYKIIHGTAYLRKDQKMNILSRLLPYFPGFVQLDKEWLHDEVARLEQENLQRIQAV